MKVLIEGIIVLKTLYLMNKVEGNDKVSNRTFSACKGEVFSKSLDLRLKEHSLHRLN